MATRSFLVTRPSAQSNTRPWHVPFALSLLLATAHGCGADRPLGVVSRTLWRGSLGDVDVVIGAGLHGWHHAGHFDTSLGKWVSGYDTYRVAESLVVTRAGAAARGYDTATMPASSQAMRDDQPTGLARLALTTVLVCPVSQGLVYRLGERGWTALWVAGQEVFRAPLALDGTSCDAIQSAIPDRVAHLSAHPGGATTCRALDDAGFREAAVDCLLQGSTDDLRPWRAPDAPRQESARLVTRRDYQILMARLASDSTAMARLQAAGHH